MKRDAYRSVACGNFRHHQPFFLTRQQRAVVMLHVTNSNSWGWSLLLLSKHGHRYSAPIATTGADEDTHQGRGKSVSDRPLLKG